jgi:Uri superfamily endonuclease
MIGSYILTLKMGKGKEIQVGKLGKINFKKGFYCYAGSAMGRSVKIESRTARHRRLDREKKGKLRWHIDYLLTDRDTAIVDLVAIESEERLECRLSDALVGCADSSVDRFGSSDCGCRSHLHHFREMPDIEGIIQQALG